MPHTSGQVPNPLPSGLTIPSPSITGTVTLTTVPNITNVLAKSALPLVGLSSGSVSAVGAISGITALPVAYPHAFCYFPANALATSIAAGWHYCTFSTTTAGTAYLNTWTPGTEPPTVPSSPTAVTDGKGAFTGVTTEQGIIIPIAAGSMGPNGRIDVSVRMGYNNSAGSKTLRVRHSGAAGTIYLSAAPTTTVSIQMEVVIANAGSASAQSGFGQVVTTPATIGQSSAPTVGTVDTTAATDVRVTTQRNTATDNAVIESLLIKQTYGS